MQRMVSSKQLQRWAEEDRDARATLPGLIRRLAHATLDEIERIDFPAYESVQRPGFDGEMKCSGGNAWVPCGHTVWELSVQKQSASKAKSDFNKRTERTAEESRKDATYVVVTARHWRDKKKWEVDAAALGEWKAVRAYDCDDIEQWMEAAPAVALWLADQLGLPVDDLSDLETRWRAISKCTTPPLGPAVYLTSRERSRNALIDWLSGENGCLTIVSPFPTEVVDFVCAVVASCPDAEREAARSRMVIAKTVTAIRQIARLEKQVIVLVEPQVELTGEDITAAIERGNRIIRAREIVDPLPSHALRLERAREHELSKQLQECGLSEVVAEQRARQAGGSMAVLKESLARTGRSTRADQFDETMRGSLRACLLLGGWNGGNPADRIAVEQIAGKPYSEVETDCNLWANRRDPLLIYADNKWRLISKGDAWAVFKNYISKRHLEDFQPLAVSIFRDRFQPFESSNPERSDETVEGCSPKYSSTIRKHLADTLALLGAFAENVSQDGKLPVQGFANAVVREVLSPDAPGEHWASLHSLLPLVAEASPDAYLDSVESDLTSAEPKLRMLFREAKGHPLFSGCLYSGLLWSLESLAWAPEYLPRVCSVLLKLHKLHVPSNYSNSPMGSLELILSCALPYTTGSVDLRIGILNQLLERDEPASWDLFVALLEQLSGGFFTPTNRPAWRTWAANWEQGATYVDQGKQLEIVSVAIIEHVGVDFERWSQVIDLLTTMPDSVSQHAMARLENLASSELDDPKKAAFHEKILNYVSLYRGSGATERIGEANLARLEAIADSMTPTSLLVRYTPLFGRGMDRYYARAAKYEVNHASLEEDRSAALQEIIDASGFEGVRELAEMSREPFVVGRLLAVLTADRYLADVIPDLIREDGWSLNFVYGFVSQRFQTEGWPWLDGVIDHCESDNARAWLYAMAPLGPAAWDRVDGQTGDVKRLYWSNVKHWGVDRSSEVVERCVRELVAHGRIAHATDVLCAALYDKSLLSSDLLLSPLEAILDSPTDLAKSRMSGIDEHDVGMILTAVQKAGDIDDARLIRVEINFIKMLGGDHEGQPATLFSKLANEPSFFVELLTWCYRSKHDRLEPDDEDISDEELSRRRARARIGGDLLYKWKILPGTATNGGVDESALSAWVASARSNAEPLGYLDLCDSKIGEMIAHAPADPDGSWPIRSVRRVAEKIATERLGSGIFIGKINSRGVVCRGEGGRQERELADQYKTLADRVRVDAPFVASILDKLQKHYLGEGIQWDGREEWEW
jgi:hypothetical protein